MSYFALPVEVCAQVSSSSIHEIYLCIFAQSSEAYSSVNVAYSSLVMVFPLGSPETWIFAIQASPSGSLFTLPGVLSSPSLTSVTIPETGVRMSEADFTDSTEPIASPSLTSVSTAGSSM